MENSMMEPQKLKIKCLCDPEILRIGIYTKELKAGSQTDICAFVFIVALFTIARSWVQPKFSSTYE